MSKITKEEKELLANQRKAIIIEILDKIKADNIDLYYAPTIEISYEIHHFIHHDALAHEKKELVQHLSQEDIKVILSLNNS